MEEKKEKTKVKFKLEKSRPSKFGPPLIAGAFGILVLLGPGCTKETVEQRIESKNHVVYVTGDGEKHNVYIEKKESDIGGYSGLQMVITEGKKVRERSREFTGFKLRLERLKKESENEKEE